MDRSQLEQWLRAAIDAADAEEATARSLTSDGRPTTIIAIGKAAAAMARGASRSLGEVTGICVTDHVAEVPPGVSLMIGDHPVPGERSFAAGRAVLDVARAANDRLIALISGGGSALCECPLEGVPEEFVARVNQVLLTSGATIAAANLIRAHLSALKGGGLSRVAPVPVETIVVSDVAGAGAEIVASGPTLRMRSDPMRAIDLMEHYGIEVGAEIRDAISRPRSSPTSNPIVVADGRTALRAVSALAASSGVAVHEQPRWLTSGVTACLDHLFARAEPGLNLAVGEPTLRVEGDGRGGRSTHAALLAASRVAGSSSLFAALATDGCDGCSGSAGAIVDGETLARGGDPAESISRFDSAGYLNRSGDLILTGPTGTNVGDLWALWC